MAFPPVSYLAFEAIEGHGDGHHRRPAAGADPAGAPTSWWRAPSPPAGAGAPPSAWLVLLLPLLWDGWVLARIDLLSVALALGGLALVRRRRRDGAVGVALAASALAKVWSVALLPGLVRRAPAPRRPGPPS